MKSLKKLAGFVFYFIFILSFVWVSGQLFFEKQTNALLASVTEYFLREDVSVEKITHLKVVYPDEPQTLEPTLTDPTVRQRINNIYEPLVRPDRDLTMRPALALSWGLMDDTTWDFRLRPNVFFHDGTPFTVLDVIASLNRAMNHESSQLTGLLASIESMQVIDELRFRITTRHPDPLLLQRLSSVLIIPAEFEEKENFEPVGTGSYEFLDWDRGDKITLKRFENYWDPISKFEKVDMFSRLNKTERVMMFVNGDAHFLAFVPYDTVDFLEERNFEIVGIPSLEVQFLVFNMNSTILDDVGKRRVISMAVDQTNFVEQLGGYAHPVSQFISNGVFGFNPRIEHHVYDLEKADSLAEELELKGKTLTLHLPMGLTVLGEHMRQQLAEIGIYLIVSYLEPSDFLASIQEGKADIYFLGFRASRGDSADFLDVVVHSDAEFNLANYSNPEVDLLIEQSFMEMDPSVRIADLQEVMRIIVEEDVLGIPLFEYNTLYSFTDSLEFTPRIDGFIYFDELRLK